MLKTRHARAWQGRYNSVIASRCFRWSVRFPLLGAPYSGIGLSTSTDVIAMAALFKDQQESIVGRIKASLKTNGLKCSMVATETFHHSVWAVLIPNIRAANNPANDPIPTTISRLGPGPRFLTAGAGGRWDSRPPRRNICGKSSVSDLLMIGLALWIYDRAVCADAIPVSCTLNANPEHVSTRGLKARRVTSE